MHIMLFGGSFDPPHKGHSTIVHTILSQRIAEEVWYIPCNNHPFHKNMSDAKHRVMMLSCILEKSSSIKTYELEKVSPSYTIETLRYYKKTFPEHTFSFLIGSDNVNSFTEWHKYKELLKEFQCYVYPRTHHPPTNILHNMHVLSHVPEMALSSTNIRENVKNNIPIHTLVSPCVESYINKHKLYLRDSLCRSL